MFIGDSIVRKTDRALSNGGRRGGLLSRDKNRGYHREDKKIVGLGKGGSITVHIGTDNAGREDTTAIVRKYRQLVRRAKQTQVEQTILSGILPVRSRGH